MFMCVNLIEWKGVLLDYMKYLKYIGKVIIAGILALILLSVFSYVYSFSGLHVYNESGATDYKWMPHQYKSNMTEGFSWLRMDANGFNNASAHMDNDIDILLMGGSHMEAVNVAPNENTGYLLNEMLPDKVTYNIGMSGHTIYTCVQNLRDALNEYDPSDYVIIETNTIHMDEESVNAVISDMYPEIPSYDSGWIYAIQKNMPIVKSLYKQIDIWRSQGTAGAVNIADIEQEDNSEPARTLLHEVSSTANDKTVTPVIIYHPTVSVDEDGSVAVPDADDYRDCFARMCADEGIIFVDMTDDFVSLYEEQHILAHGFVNTRAGVGHLNRYGHEAAAKVLADTIMELERNAD